MLMYMMNQQRVAPTSCIISIAACISLNLLQKVCTNEVNSSLPEPILTSSPATVSLGPARNDYKQYTTATRTTAGQTDSFRHKSTTTHEKETAVTHETFDSGRFANCLKVGRVRLLRVVEVRLKFNETVVALESKVNSTMGETNVNGTHDKNSGDRIHRERAEKVEDFGRDRQGYSATCLLEIAGPKLGIWAFTMWECSGISLRAYENSSEHSGVLYPDNYMRNRSRGEAVRHNPNLRLGNPLRRMTCDSWHPMSHVFSTRSTVWLELSVSGNATVSLHLHMAAVLPTVAPTKQLHVVYTSPTTGFVQTPFWDGQTPYPPLLRSCVTVTAPTDRLLFISMAVLDVVAPCDPDSHQLLDDSDMMVIIKGPCGARSRVMHMQCYLYRPPPYLLPESGGSVSWYLATTEVANATGFRAQFSFHKQSSALRQLPGGKWNCSVAFWGEYRHHFPCDLVPQCVGGEDEAACPYTTARCGQGWLDVAGDCYLFGRFSNETTWYGAKQECADRGGRLASLETPEKLDAMIRELSRADVFIVFIGLRSVDRNRALMYRAKLQWTSGSMAYYLNIGGYGLVPLCGAVSSDHFRIVGRKHFYSEHAMVAYSCSQFHKASFLCDFPSRLAGAKKMDRVTKEKSGPAALHVTPDYNSVPFPFQVSTCPQGHVTHTFLVCGPDSACWRSSSGETDGCGAALTPLPPTFPCANGEGRVQYSLLCDFRQDCRDGSDEHFCRFLSAALCHERDLLVCGTQTEFVGQCVPKTKECDGIEDCVSGIDESCCFRKKPILFNIKSLPPPAIVTFTKSTKILMRNLTTPECPPGHFQCPDNGYCFPVHFRCNGMWDCPLGEDEEGCSSYACPGFYRCRASRICISKSLLCDKRTQCPFHDDEMMCSVVCPDSCQCYGFAFYCSGPSVVGEVQQLRFLEARGSGMSFDDVSSNKNLVHLGIGACGLQSLADIELPWLHTLDISDNELRYISLFHFEKYINLRSVNLARNPLVGITVSEGLADGTQTLRVLDLSGTFLRSFDSDVIKALASLHALNVSHSGLRTLKGLGAFVNLKTLDMRGCGELADFSSDDVRSMLQLEVVYADKAKQCCPSALPDGFNPNNCFAPYDSLSSCEALLRSNVYRVALTIFAVLALLGNMSSFLYRLRLPNRVRNLGFHVFVTQLTLSDFLMGVYLAMIGVADRIYLGSYLWQSEAWKNSVVCRAAGFLSFLSNETSAFMVCLITLDRFLAIHFPFSSRHFKGRSAYVASGVAWTAGFLLALVPLLPATSHWRLYSQSGLCLSLPIRHEVLADHGYAQGVLIFFNLALFLLTALGQGLIYWSIQSAAISTVDSATKGKDAVIARRLLTVVMTDFMCWCPIGICGALSHYGLEIPGEVIVAMAIFVVPLNSAINPFLYTLNVLLEKRRKQREERIQRFLRCEIKAGRFHVQAPDRGELPVL